MSGSLGAGRREMLAADELASPILPHRIWEFLQSTPVDLSNGSCINTEKPCSDEEDARWPKAAPLALIGILFVLLGYDVRVFVFRPNLPFELGIGIWLMARGFN